VFLYSVLAYPVTDLIYELSQGVIYKQCLTVTFTIDKITKQKEMFNCINMGKHLILI